MTWTRLSDNWCESNALERLPIAHRWHYLCMIQYCSRSERYDGIMNRSQALRCSDIEHPESALADLMAAGFIQPVDDRLIRLVEIDEHVPSAAQRERKERDKLRKRRERAHAKGDHSLCIRESCSAARNTSEHVTRTVQGNFLQTVGTGQDRQGQEDFQELKNSSTQETSEDLETYPDWEDIPGPEENIIKMQPGNTMTTPPLKDLIGAKTA